MITHKDHCHPLKDTLSVARCRNTRNYKRRQMEKRWPGTHHSLRAQIVRRQYGFPLVNNHSQVHRRLTVTCRTKYHLLGCARPRSALVRLVSRTARESPLTVRLLSLLPIALPSNAQGSPIANISIFNIWIIHCSRVGLYDIGWLVKWDGYGVKEQSNAFILYFLMLAILFAHRDSQPVTINLMKS